MKLTKTDLVPYEQYKNMHDKFLKEVIAEKKLRRIQINDRMTGLFESKLTVFYQIQEMIRAEQITRDDYIEEMLEVYNDLLPYDNELSMTLFIEIPNQDELRRFNKSIVGIENSIKLVYGDYSVTSYEPGDEEEDEDYTQSVHYLHFPFNEDSKKAFQQYDGDVFIKADHKNYQTESIISKETIKELKKQLGE